MLRVCVIGGQLLKAVHSFYVDSRVCVWEVMDVNEWKQDCVMSPWLLNDYMDGVVREVNVRVLGTLLRANGGWFEITQLLFIIL